MARAIEPRAVDPHMGPDRSLLRAAPTSKLHTTQRYVCTLPARIFGTRSGGFRVTSGNENNPAG
jgi:hypothetical protein